MIGKGSPKIGYISSTPDPQRNFYDSVSSYYQYFDGRLGSYNDLEDAYDEDAMQDVFRSDAIHLTGGNTYRFLASIRSRALEARLIEYATNGGTLIGVSAGAIIISLSIESSGLCHDSNKVGITDLDGLNLFPFQLLPHAQDIDDLSDKANSLAAKINISVYAIRDDQALFFSDSKVQAIGGAEYFPVINGPQKRDNKPWVVNPLPRRESEIET